MRKDSGWTAFRGLHHYLFTQDSIKIVGTTWLRYNASGFFD